LQPAHITVHCRTGSLESDGNGKMAGIGVHCRTGSLENDGGQYIVLRTVHCRTGSLESGASLGQRMKSVHCRTGSLERSNGGKKARCLVHCRTGSLEKIMPAFPRGWPPNKGLAPFFVANPTIPRLFGALIVAIQPTTFAVVPAVVSAEWLPCLIAPQKMYKYTVIRNAYGCKSI
jgi:hypothetical protein